MSDNRSVFLNGRYYDVLTGKVISHGENQKAKHSSHSNNLITNTDGFVKNAAAADHYLPRKLSHGSSKSSSIHDIAPHLNRATQHSKTLMRKAVRLPKAAKTELSGRTSKNPHTPIRKVDTHNPSLPGANGARISPRGTFTNRFRNAPAVSQPVPSSSVASKVAAQLASAPPVANIEPAVAARQDPPISLNTSVPQNISSSTDSLFHQKNIDKLDRAEKSQDIDEILSEAALRLADSHQPAQTDKIKFYQRLADKLRISEKMLFVLSIILFVLVVGGSSAYVFSANIAIYFADSRTGVHALLPSYIPPGYKLQDISYTLGNPTGSVRIEYQYKNTSNSFYLIESATSWDNTSLVNTVVQPSVGYNYKTYMVGGRSIYMYSTNAVWIDSGIYYTLSNGSHLTPSQITQIVSTT